MKNLLLFPRDVLRPNRPDDHFSAEADAARSLDIDIGLIDHDAIATGNITDGIRGLSEVAGRATYRGWMLTPSAYTSVASALAGRGVDLLTSPAEYRHGHQLPSWYPKLAGLTPESTWTSSDDVEEFITAISDLDHGAAVIKDYSKSEKHYWEEAMFIPDLTDQSHARAVASRFRELRGAAFDTGYVIRRFENLAAPEARTWWRDGVCVGMSSHPDTPEVMPESLDLASIKHKMAGLGLPFVSADVAIQADTGATRIVEIGDGQVSDRPTSFDPTEFVAAITNTNRGSDA